jgi:hypothetical protein
MMHVYNIVGAFCVTTAGGQAVYDKIVPLLREGKKISLSFAKVELIIPTFLNVAIGQLYGVFTSEQIRELLTVTDMEPDHLVMLKAVVDNAKKYFANRGSKEKVGGLEEGD